MEDLQCRLCKRVRAAADMGGDLICDRCEDQRAGDLESSQEDVSSGPSGSERLNEEHRQAWAGKEGR